MFKIKKIILPDKNYVNKYTTIITYLTIFYFICLMYLFLKFKKSFTYFDKILVYVIFFDIFLGFYSSVIYWNPYMLSVAHYIFMLMFFIVLLSNNNYILYYYFSLFIIMLLVWKFNNNRCIFDKINFEIEFMGKPIKSEQTLNYGYYILFILYPLKIYFNLNKN